MWIQAHSISRCDRSRNKMHKKLLHLPFFCAAGVSVKSCVSQEKWCRKRMRHFWHFVYPKAPYGCILSVSEWLKQWVSATECQLNLSKQRISVSVKAEKRVGERGYYSKYYHKINIFIIKTACSTPNWDCVCDISVVIIFVCFQICFPKANCIRNGRTFARSKISRFSS